MADENDVYDDDIIMTTTGLVYDPFNSLNKQITLAEVHTLLGNFGLTPPKDINLEIFKRAFVHKSYVKCPKLENEKKNVTVVEKPDGCLPLSTKSNERLEFVGDGVLECATKFYLYFRFPKSREGFMTDKKIDLVKNETIGMLAFKMGLHNWFIISRHAEERKIRTNHKKLGCLFESFLAAIFLTYNKVSAENIDDVNVESMMEQIDDDEKFQMGLGFQAAFIFVKNVFEKFIDWTDLVTNDTNYKNMLQVKIQKEFKITPEYIEIDSDKETGFLMGVYICLNQKVHETSHELSEDISKYHSIEEIKNAQSKNEKLLIFLGNSRHKIKKKAEQNACEIAISKLEKISNT